MSYSAKTIAKWFLAWAGDDQDGDNDLTAMKLQKILYYAQGHTLAETGEPLFKEKIKAWSHGPVVPQVWHVYNQEGKSVLSPPPEADFSWDEVDEETAERLERVWNTYGGFSAAKLRNMTHAESPWRDAWDRGGDSPEMPVAEIKQFFQTATAPRTQR